MLFVAILSTSYRHNRFRYNIIYIMLFFFVTIY